MYSQQRPNRPSLPGTFSFETFLPGCAPICRWIECADHVYFYILYMLTPESCTDRTCSAQIMAFLESPPSRSLWS